MEDQESRVVRVSGENRNPIDDDDEQINRIKELIARAEGLEECLSCKKCSSLLEVLKKISLDARERLVHINPQETISIIQTQQTAKVFDAVELSIKNTVMEGQMALDEISS